MGDAGADTLPWQPASQGSKLHASALSWVLCPKLTHSWRYLRQIGKSTHRNVAFLSGCDLFWCAKNRVHINWLNLEQFPL
ncbi:hypothetical protein B6D51_10185 [Pseudomonas chlororaphis subsp. chlororaphis]|nr:hypothetical protein B6D51_10185 [Pseudomonas chlororaphis subsp. chlororaphis]TWR93835.1 hypothetical protein FJD36_20945 [Pseudomonas chlororaphis subsp. chlororaphis]